MRMRALGLHGCIYISGTRHVQGAAHATLYKWDGPSRRRRCVLREGYPLFSKTWELCFEIY
jgi:hypothetical protein